MLVKHVQASSTVETTFAYECSACGYAGRADVVGEGYAESDTGSALFVDHTAESRALDHAEGAAWNDALTTVELAPCPKCGKRDSARWGAWVRAQLIGVIAWGLLGGLLGCVGTFLLRQEMDTLPLLVGAGLSLVVAVGVGARRVVRKRTHAATLRFEPPT